MHVTEITRSKGVTYQILYHLRDKVREEGSPEPSQTLTIDQQKFNLQSSSKPLRCPKLKLV
ncbi:protein of unknown function, might related with transposase IS3/IS911 family protein [Shewanella benthica]|uniref:Uncharacterized protein n=1 Tax=Shewanella benthica TaxID=43661 RepID=A0A330M0D4_9GAMM|nr:protein of unknown function, might related with transposase IS3/IS911 family protein [Shewanella benthica]